MKCPSSTWLLLRSRTRRGTSLRGAYLKRSETRGGRRASRRSVGLAVEGFGLIERFSEDLDLKVEPGRVTGVPAVTNWKSDGTKRTSSSGSPPRSKSLARRSSSSRSTSRGERRISRSPIRESTSAISPGSCVRSPSGVGDLATVTFVQYPKATCDATGNVVSGGVSCSEEGVDVCYGENWTRQILQGVAHAKESDGRNVWYDAATGKGVVIVVTCDWSSAFDHVPPAAADCPTHSRAMRVPLMVISPFARRAGGCRSEARSCPLQPASARSRSSSKTSSRGARGWGQGRGTRAATVICSAPSTSRPRRGRAGTMRGSHWPHAREGAPVAAAL